MHSVEDPAREQLLERARRAVYRLPAVRKQRLWHVALEARRP